MSHPTGPGQPDEKADEIPGPSESEESQAAESDAEHEPATEIMAPAEPETEDSSEQIGERRFTAPSGFDAGSTQIIDRPVDPATEVFSMAEGGQTEAFGAQKAVPPVMIPPRGDAPQPPKKRRSWGWVAAIVLIIAALAGIAVLGTIILTRTSTPAVSQEEMVRNTIQDFDIAVQNGDLSTLRSITCGATRDSYVRYNEKAWSDTHSRVAAAKQYPVVASIDQVVVNGDHAEANVTTFMAYAPQTRSTRSFDLEFRDEQWKICQAPAS
ncbi:hypothetical protein NGTWS0302_01210 [Mycolicibacterium cyprinidarum]|uniref:DUF4878 domain-containing protein n=1 Tax=Mycolicibacterium cyprinidarum TaxID=2860311 RepID=A0ABQ4VD00_9MYCO|nr:hypothetical protein NGTWS0302_01210 [Mycolicibacterium sp. NGTWS0302]GJF12751.1 hypothetical protein NGTWS1702_12060 [Mycolicibacterium sp. NGTWSNA01]GJF20059.1 hypothetical protein NGTWS1803_10280 [Mycolicibacterium sp. NGTWS1803]